MTELVLNKLGLGFADISASLELRYKDLYDEFGNLKDKSGLKGSLAIKNEKGENMISVSLELDAPKVEFSQIDIEGLDKAIGEGYVNVALFNDDGTINLEGLYLELSGSLGASKRSERRVG